MMKYETYEERREREKVERFEKLESAYPGMPATKGIGSDSYAYMVTSVERFKTGANAGKVKAVTAERAELMDGLLLNVGDPVRFLPTKNGYLTHAKSYSLYLGEATDYRDPSF
jgi:hypothetical protein